MKREVLDKPFPPELIRTRAGSFGRELSYVEAAHYIQRLNEAFDGLWSFEVLQHEVTDREVIVLGRITAEGIVKTAFGGGEITRRKETGESICLADDLKAAATDSLKKAASLLGLGLHLYENGEGRPENKGNGQNGQQPSRNRPDNSRLTGKQLEAILAIGREHGLDRQAVGQLAQQQFGRQLEFISKAEASLLIKQLKTAAEGDAP